MTHLFRALGLESCRQVDVPPRAVEGCDAVWLPWLHLHTMPDADVSRVVATFHDAIFFQFPRMLPPVELAREREGIGRWLASPARIVVTSNATAAAVSALCSVGLDRLDVIRVSGEHAPSAAATLPSEWTWARDSFLIYPANLSSHKNHETLMRGLGRSSVRHPLVLTGPDADLRPPARGRAADILRVAQKSGLRLGERLHTLGYVSSGILQTLIERAWALVMPTMGEGGGSFPIFEALLAGVPVVCSDIPVLREQMTFLRAEVLWFDPQRPADLAEKLDILAADYPRYKSMALAQREALTRRSWLEVADEYWRVFNRTGSDPR
jgi:glycosyltransferase involved in cell wall biosynthesis